MAEVHINFLNWWRFPNLTSLLSYFQSKHKFEVYPVLLHWCDFANFKKMLKYTLYCYIADLLPSLNIAEVNPAWLLCRDTPKLDTLLRYALFSYIADFSPILIHCWANSKPKTIPEYTLFSSYIAVILPILKHCWSIHWIATLLTYSHFRINAEVNLVWSHSWAAANLNTLLRYTLLFLHCWPLRNLDTLLRYILTFSKRSHIESNDVAELLPSLIQSWKLLRCILTFPLFSHTQV